MSNCNCAAGPWNTDVESAPYQPDVLVRSSLGVISLATRTADGRFITVPGRWNLPDATAWATINTPESAAAHQAALKPQQLNDMEHTS